MAKALISEVGEIAKKDLEIQQGDGIASKKFTDFKISAIMAFENPGLYHIGENILKNLDIQTKLKGRLT